MLVTCLQVDLACVQFCDDTILYNVTYKASVYYSSIVLTDIILSWTLQR